jgi:hypothetical protein
MALFEMSYLKGKDIKQKGDCIENIDIKNGIDIRYHTDKPKIILVIDNKIYTWDCVDYDKPEGFDGW